MSTLSTTIRERKKLDKIYTDAYRKIGVDPFNFRTQALWAQYKKDKGSMNKRLYSRGYLSTWKDSYKPDVPNEGEGFKLRYNTSHY